MENARMLKVATFAVMLSLLAVPLTATATHNSLGVDVQIVQADEYDRSTGELTPDVPADSEYHTTYHANLAEQYGLTERPSPPDQVGNRYTDCTSFADYNGDRDAYLADLDANDNLDGSGDGTVDGDACYVGYLDHQVEYYIITSPFVKKWPTSWIEEDPVNEQPYGMHTVAPSEENEAYCNGQEDTEETTGVAPADEVLTAVDRKTTEPRCGTGHEAYMIGATNIDINLLEAPFEAAADQVGTDTASGTMSLPFLGVTYVYLFGQPHPSNSDPSEFNAGEGVFGANPAEGGNPIMDITGACGDRTADCKLLTPADIKAFDPFGDENFGDDPAARVCNFQTQYTYAVLGDDGSIDRDKGKCGNRGNTVDTFIHTDLAGGANNPAGAPTWVGTLPGWYWGVLYIVTQWTGDDAVSYANDYQDDEQDFREGWYQYTAVNPKVPSISGPLRCVLPNMLTDGGTVTVDGTNFADAGIYGSYQADAIDTDVFVSFWHQPAKDVRDDHHDTVRGVDSQVDDAVAMVEDELDSITDMVPALAVPSDVGDLQNRTDYTEDSNDEPQNLLNNTQHDFDHTDPAGLACDPGNVIRLNKKATTFWGGVRMNVQLHETTPSVNYALKDPTLLEDGLPANVSNTTWGPWMVQGYSFNGGVNAALDTNKDGDLDGCAVITGGAQPNSDFCPWRALWDAYNDQCTDFSGARCSDLLINRGYNVNGTNHTGAILAGEAGVGMYSVIKMSGPMVIDGGETDAGATTAPVQVIGAGVATAQNCIVAVSIGFEEYLPDLLGEDNMDAVEDTLCDGANGEHTTILDGFGDQSADDPGGFSASFDIYKLTPTPSAVTEATGVGVDDGICVTGIWNVQENEAASTTGGVATDTNELGLTSGKHVFSDCDSFEPSVNEA